ncbi:unnamed protein product [Staurois parvus]|uniref:Metalloendopeptidase n=1 Tax=Staurois parvus TaxID=386267 RepID=A0ABN9CNE0_9NEOB|nr:unnamed protein product [Staurois parvus]
MQEYETLTCVRFVNWTTETDYIDIASSGGCLSYIGRIGGAQSLLIYSPGCMQRAIIQHELQHALGFYHENARIDRDQYIIVRTEYIIPELLYNFNLVTEGDMLGLPYDYTSVMHYDKYAFTINASEPTIIPTPNPDTDIGQRYGLTVLDVKKVNKLYNCSVCSKLLNETWGNFSSTDFSTEYPTTGCVWLIRVPDGQVALTFTYFNIQNTECVPNYMVIYDGPTKNYPLLVDRACGTVQYPTIISSTDQMLIEFVSHDSDPSAGFTASYKTVQCGGFYSGAVRQITSPGYNTGEYPPNLNCNYTILAPVGYQVRHFLFLFFFFFFFFSL